MKKILLALAVCFCGAVSAEDIVLDLSNPGAPIEYDENGLWTDVFNNDANVYSQEFLFSHGTPYPEYSNGFFASKVTSISASASSDDQWGCMAKGGVAGEGTPFLGAFWDSYNETAESRSCEVYTSSPYYAVGFYVCNNPYAYYAIKEGNPYSTKFEQGSWFKLIVHGVDENAVETGTVEYYLADYRSENAEEWTLNNSWEWVDLSSLGEIASIYFTMESSDSGQWGMNTPAYFCLDKLTVSTDEPTSVDEVVAAPVKAYYDRSAGCVRVHTSAPAEVSVYSVNGAWVAQQTVVDSAAIDLTAVPSGVYIVRCGAYSVKIVK